MQNVKSKPAQGKAVRPIPEGFHTVTPFVIVHEAQKFIDFINKAFNGELTYVFKGDNNEIIHATVRIGDSTIMVAEPMKDLKARPVLFQLYVEDVDAQYQQAVKAGGVSVSEPEDQFYGDRSSCVKDSWGNQWWMATHVEDVSDEEVRRRHEEFRQEKV